MHTPPPSKWALYVYHPLRTERLPIRTFGNTNFKCQNADIVPPSQHEMSLRDLNQISIERDSSEISQKHLKRDVFFVTSLRRLKYISKKMSFP